MNLLLLIRLVNQCEGISQVQTFVLRKWTKCNSAGRHVRP